MHASAFIKKRWYWPKKFPGDLIDRHFWDKYLGDVDMLEDASEDDNPFNMLLFKYRDYVMKIISSCMTLDELYGTNKNRNCKVRDCESLVKHFKY